MVSSLLGEYIELSEGEAGGVVYKPGDTVELLDNTGKVTAYQLEKIGKFEKSEGIQFAFRHPTDNRDYRPMGVEKLLRNLKELEEVKNKKRSVFKVSGYAYMLVSEKVETAITAKDEDEARELFEEYITYKGYDGLRDDLYLTIDCMDEDQED
jgi:hypothetical protein